MYTRTILWGVLFLVATCGGLVFLGKRPEPVLSSQPTTSLPPAAETASSAGKQRQMWRDTHAVTQDQKKPSVPGSTPVSGLANTPQYQTRAVRPAAIRAESGRPADPPAVSKAPMGDTSVPARPIIDVQHQRVRLRVRNTPLHVVLRDITRQAGISLTDHSDTRTVVTTIDLDNMAIDEALKRLLAEFDAFFFYRGAGGETAELQAVWIYPKGYQIQTPPGADSSMAVEALGHEDPAERARAYEELISRPDELPPAVLLDGLQDVDAQVRLRVLSQALMANVVLPVETVESLVSTDPDAQVRLAALSAIGFHPDLDRQRAERIALEASHDPDAAVQSKALELMEHLDVTPAGDVAEVWQAFDGETEAVAPEQMGVPAQP